MADLKEIKIESKKDVNRMDALEDRTDALEEMIMMHSRKIDELEDRVKVLEDAVVNLSVSNLQLSSALLSLTHRIQANYDLISDALIFNDKKEAENETKSNAKKKNRKPCPDCSNRPGCSGRYTDSCQRIKCN